MSDRVTDDNPFLRWLFIISLSLNASDNPPIWLLFGVHCENFRAERQRVKMSHFKRIEANYLSRTIRECFLMFLKTF